MVSSAASLSTGEIVSDGKVAMANGDCKSAACLKMEKVERGAMYAQLPPSKADHSWEAPSYMAIVRQQRLVDRAERTKQLSQDTQDYIA
jgi:hypothetical protein